jgi:hypothetical protein
MTCARVLLLARPCSGIGTGVRRHGGWRAARHDGAPLVADAQRGRHHEVGVQVERGQLLRGDAARQRHAAAQQQRQSLPPAASKLSQLYGKGLHPPQHICKRRPAANSSSARASRQQPRISPNRCAHHSIIVSGGQWPLALRLVNPPSIKGHVADVIGRASQKIVMQLQRVRAGA